MNLRLHLRALWDAAATAWGDVKAAWESYAAGPSDSACPRCRSQCWRPALAVLGGLVAALWTAAALIAIWKDDL